MIKSKHWEVHTAALRFSSRSVMGKEIVCQQHILLKVRRLGRAVSSRTTCMPPRSIYFYLFNANNTAASENWALKQSSLSSGPTPSNLNTSPRTRQPITKPYSHASTIPAAHTHRHGYTSKAATYPRSAASSLTINPVGTAVRHQQSALSSKNGEGRDYGSC